MTFDEHQLQAAVRQILLAVGEDPTREGLTKTPERVARAYRELLAGYGMDPATILERTFAREGYDEMVTLRGVAFFSLCEHHLLPFHGTASLSYVPRKRIVGLSKLARLVECFARRLQVQERMTAQIAGALKEYVQPLGWGVMVRATHLCMCARGVGKPGAEMTTTAIGGAYFDKPEARAEWLATLRA